MVRESRFPRHSFLFHRKLEKFAQRNFKGLGNLIDHARAHIVFPAFNSPDLLPGIAHEKPQVFLGHVPGQSQLSHPVSQGIQKIFVYHILHIQVWKFKKRLESPYMGYFMVFIIFGKKRNIQKRKQ